MKGIDLKTAGGLVAAATLGLSAVFGVVASRGPQAPPDAQRLAAEPGRDMGAFASVETMTRADGGVTQIVMLDEDSYFDYRRQRGVLSGVSAFFRGYNHDLRDDLQAHLLRGGLPEGAARTIARTFADTYHYFDSVSPYAMHVQERGGAHLPEYTTDENLYCLIAHTNDDYSGVDWMKFFLQLPESARPNMPANYDAEFAAFIVLHEQAHCMLGDEPQADYVAARVLLQEHPDTAKAEAFVRLMRDIRWVTGVLAERGFNEYDGTAAALTAALQDHAAGPAMSRRDLLAASAQSGHFTGPTLERAREYIPDRMRDQRDLRVMAQHLTGLPGSENVQGALLRVAAITEGRPARPAVTAARAVPIRGGVG